MASQDSDDYELMPRQELEDLRREVSALKKGNLTEGDKAKVLIESMDRLAISINRLITILDDAQKDLIDEYQQSKPAEKLNQLVEQNEMIAKALIALNENLGGGSSEKNIVAAAANFPNMPTMPSNQSPGGPRSMLPLPESSQSQNFGGNQMPPLDDMPPMGSMPPLDNPAPNNPKKRFLGIM